VQLLHCAGSGGRQRLNTQGISSVKAIATTGDFCIPKPGS
jgi:hypothetical protein